MTAQGLMPQKEIRNHSFNNNMLDPNLSGSRGSLLGLTMNRDESKEGTFDSINLEYLQPLVNDTKNEQHFDTSVKKRRHNR